MGGSRGYWRRSMRAGRAVHAPRSPIMGGVSKWNIPRDTEIASWIPVFGPAPEVATGVLSEEVQQVWRAWNPLAWQVIQTAEILTAEDLRGEDAKMLAADRLPAWQRMTFALTRLAHTRSRRAGGA